MVCWSIVYLGGFLYNPFCLTIFKCVPLLDSTSLTTNENTQIVIKFAWPTIQGVSDPLHVLGVNQLSDIFEKCAVIGPFDPKRKHYLVTGWGRHSDIWAPQGPIRNDC